VAQIHKTKEGYKYVFIPRDFPSDYALVKIYESHIELYPYYPESERKTEKERKEKEPGIIEEYAIM
jgi:ribonucleotide reductase alpha subunit